MSIATLLAAFPLIFMGGLVTSVGAGLSVPDWPNSYGYNMWLFPPSMWIGGIFYEHTHRLLGTVVGLLSIAMVMNAFGVGRRAGMRRLLGWSAVALFGLAGAAFGAKLWVGVALAGSSGSTLQKAMPHLSTGFLSLAVLAGVAWAARHREARRWVRWLAVAVLVSVIIQGIKGGLRVELVNLTLAITHGIFGQVVLCMIAAMCLVTSRWWQRARAAKGSPLSGSRQLAWTSLTVVALVLVQLTLGAVMRHHNAGLAIPDLPLAYGKLLPPSTPEAVAEANRYRLSLNSSMLGPVDQAKIYMHFAHRVGAVVVSAGMIFLCVGLYRKARLWKLAGSAVKGIPALATLLLALLTVQVSLGVATVYFLKPADVTTLHHTVGAILLMSVFLLTLRLFRLSHRSPEVAVRSAVRPEAELVPA